MAVSYYYSNTAQETTLSGSISAGATSITVGATVGFPLSYPYVLAIGYGASDEELVRVDSAAGTTLTVVRGFSGTSAQSHSLGAKVRHVYHAGDAADFRTHEAATAAVHGVTGTLVGTSDTQTLTNKTLTSPTVNSGTLASGALSGTFSGAPTFSGAAAFTGNPVFQGGTASTVAASHQVSGDSTPRLQTRADGQMLWGSGSAAADTVLYRAAADVLATDDNLRVVRAATSDIAHSVRIASDTVSRLAIEAGGRIAWGPGGSSSQDTVLYRAGADSLATDDAFSVGGNLTVTGTASAQVETTASGASPATNFSVTSFNGRRTCGVATVWVTLSYSGTTITANSAGNITNTACVTLPAGWRPPIDTVVSFDKGTVAQGSMTIASNGVCTLNTLDATATIASGDSLSFAMTFVL
jgi:hypothetical protein